MAQDRFINITLDANAASKPDITNHRHGQAMAASAAGDLTISYDTAKFTSANLLRSAILAAIQTASASMKP